MSNTNFNRQAVQFLLARAREEGRDAQVIERLEWIAHFLEHGSSLQETCTHFGITPSTLRRWIKRFNISDLSSLEEQSRSPHKRRTSAIPQEIVEKIREYRVAQPLIGKERISELLKSEQGITLSPSTVGRVIEREKLYFAQTPLHIRKRYVYEPLSQTPAVHLAPVEKQIPVQELPSEEVRVEEPLPEVMRATCDCFLCRASRHDWKNAKRKAAKALLVVNIAVLTLLATTLWNEQQYSAALKAALQPNAAEAKVVLPTIEPDSHSSSSISSNP